MKGAKAEPALDPIVAHWQEKFRLRDWRITPRWATLEELTAFFAEDEDETDPAKIAKQACAVTDASHADQWDSTGLENRTARILLKRGAFDNAAEVERTIVHEMLHILLWPIAPKDTDAMRRILLEQIINTLEEILPGRSKP